MPKITIGIKGISENLCGDESTEQPYWEPSHITHCYYQLGFLISELVNYFHLGKKTEIPFKREYVFCFLKRKKGDIFVNSRAVRTAKKVTRRNSK